MTAQTRTIPLLLPRPAELIAQDLLITAIESGHVNYWMSWLQCDDEAHSYQNVLAEGGTATVAIEDEDEKLALTPEKAVAGLVQLGQRNPRGIIDDDLDAEDADLWLQFAVLGEIVYG